MQRPQDKLIVHFLVGTLLSVLAFAAKDTSWVAWLPTGLQWVVPLVPQALALLSGYYKNETNPPASFNS